MKLDSFKLVVFDLDDTLYLERDYVDSGFRNVANWLARHYHWSATVHDQFLSRCRNGFRSGRDRHQVFDRTLLQMGMPSGAALVRCCVARYRAHMPRIRLLPDARCLLQSLSRWPTTSLCVITDGVLIGQAAKIRALRLHQWIRRVVYTDRWGRGFWKPHPRAFEMVQRRHGVPGAECVYVGDNPLKDFATPHSLGWHTIRVRRPQGIYAGVTQAPESSINLEISDLWPLCSALGSLGRCPDSRNQER